MEWLSSRGSACAEHDSHITSFTGSLCPAGLTLLSLRLRAASSCWMMLGVGQIQQALICWKIPRVACLSHRVLFLPFLLVPGVCLLRHSSSLLSLTLRRTGEVMGRWCACSFCFWTAKAVQLLALSNTFHDTPTSTITSNLSVKQWQKPVEA